jgi:hypothetical protein
MFDESDTAKVIANPGKEKGLMQLDLRKNDKLTVKTLPDKSTEITFKGGNRSQLVVTTDKNDKITLAYTNQNL